MSARSQGRLPSPQRYRWWRALHMWQRVIVVGVLLGTLVIAAGLIYFGPAAAGVPTPAPTAPGGTVTAVPRYLPGTDEYEYWGQSKPLDQQP